MSNTPQTSVREKVRKIIEKAIDIKDYDDSDADKIISIFDQELESLQVNLGYCRNSDDVLKMITTLRNTLKK